MKVIKIVVVADCWYLCLVSHEGHIRTKVDAANLRAHKQCESHSGCPAPLLVLMVSVDIKQPWTWRASHRQLSRILFTMPWKEAGDGWSFPVWNCTQGCQWNLLFCLPPCVSLLSFSSLHLVHPLLLAQSLESAALCIPPCVSVLSFLSILCTLCYWPSHWSLLLSAYHLVFLSCPFSPSCPSSAIGPVTACFPECFSVCLCVFFVVCVCRFLLL